ncbi:Myelin-oligodendrocyte glycoprotein Precursor [Channa argus]|uniref:Myelin-oligodendrocyte glycoprotein n=1 Tax=Channa argus TaxID=215402 RepID=A0A6G1Q745_CHAAH|nr:Myelin-oligodendrocyte glycoprotein Precursor [Channa argus]
MLHLGPVSRTFLLLLCLFVSVFLQGNSGQLNITAHPGQNITLPCQAPVSKDFIAVEWTRSDLKPSQYVFFFRNGRSDKTHQHPSFVNRVDLLDRQMKDGNLSLNLRNVNSSDHGTYECRVKEKERRRVLRGVINSEPVNVIRLTVTDSDLTPEGVNKGGPVGLGAGLVVLGVLALLLLVFGAIGFVVYKKCKGHNNPNSYQPPLEQDVTSSV